jgi:hypothetical protein
MIPRAALILVALGLLAGVARGGESESLSASVVASPLALSLTLSASQASVGDEVTATASATNLGSAPLSGVELELRVDPLGVVVGGGPKRTVSIAGSSSSTASWPVCGLAPGSYVVLVSGKLGPVTVESAAQVLDVLPGPGPCAESTAVLAAAGDVITTDWEGDGATPADPVETVVITPNPGQVSIRERAVPASPTAYSFLGFEVQITAPPANPGTPLELVFLLDASIVPPGPVQIFRNGVQIGACPNDPCLLAQSTLPGGDRQLIVRTSAASAWTFGTPIATRGFAAGAVTPRTGSGVIFGVAADGSQVAGALQYGSFSARRFEALAIAGRTAWFAGFGTDGRAVLVYVEDNSVNGQGDIVKVWIAGVLRTGDGRITRGDVRVNR